MDSITFYKTIIACMVGSWISLMCYELCKHYKIVPIEKKSHNFTQSDS